MSFEDISCILYTHWIFLILAVYISGALTYLIYRKLPAYNGKAVKLFALTIVGGLLLFYFVLPVPVKVQDKFIQTVQSFKKDNKAFKDTYIQLTKRKVCRNKYLNAYGYFQLKNSFIKDQEEAFKAQGSLSISTNHQDIKTDKYICE